jgi:hypothetical protein
MKNLAILPFFLLTTCLLNAQESLDSIKVINGIQLQGGVGNFGDPTVHHGFSLAMNGALGTSNKSNTFGYDAFSVNARWVPGTNKIGKRIAIQFGTANWFTPSLSTIYADTVLNQEEKFLESKSVNAFMAGLGFSIGSTRNPIDNAKEKKKLEAILEPFEKELITAKREQNIIREKEILSQIAGLRWKNLVRKTFRQPTLFFGGMFRLGTLGTESEIEIYDIHATGAAGKGVFDFVGSVHYLKPVKDNLLVKDATTFSLGAFVDLNDFPPINTMGLTIGYGNFNYLKKDRIIDMNTTVSDTPNSQRLDFTLSFSNIFSGGENLPFGSGIAFRISKLWHSSTEDENQFVIIFTNKIISASKK